MRSAMRTFAAAIASVCAAAPAFAQREWTYKVEVFGTVAHNRFYHGDNLWAARPGFGGGAGVRPFAGRLRGLGFEVQAGTIGRTEKTIESTTSRVFTSFASRHVSALASYHFFGRSGLQPFVSGGVSVVSADRTFSCEGCVFDIDPGTGQVRPLPSESRIDAKKGGLAFAGGLKIRVHPRVSIRPEILLIDTTPGSGFNWGWVRFQAGVGLHF